MITIDGSAGEGGGQVLRTALSLAMVTGKAFAIEKIRAKRSRPGLLRQHLTCVLAAETISGATVTGAELGSTAVTFVPGAIKGGTYHFAIGTAGATALVFQTILPALLHAGVPSQILLSGGTHNTKAPSFDYLDRVVCPLLWRMGASVSLSLRKPGFYPAGGGVWEAKIAPSQLVPLVIEAAGKRVSQAVRAHVATLPFLIAQREVATALALLNWPEECGQARTVKADGHGNVVMVEVGHEHVTEMFTGFGERKIAAEEVAARVVDEVRAYLSVGAPVGPHLADQLLLPMALAGGGSFVTGSLTEHARTNMDVIGRFLPVRFGVEAVDEKRWRVKVEL
ncbi:MAG: RNA 3'-terminal phosphate cyclase [Hyphomicrobiaceae bacterium]